VPATRIVVACKQCGAFWDPAAERAACADPSHDHRRFDAHLHRSRVVFPDGTEVTAVSFGSADPYAREVDPDFGLYLDERWQPPWPHDHLDWPDYGVPEDPAQVVAELESLRRRAQSGQRVEIGCYGGHGRTGTALACLAVLTGTPAAEAVAWVRINYCPKAVETRAQEQLAAAIRS
jgi:hypothetical protein